MVITLSRDVKWPVAAALVKWIVRVLTRISDQVRVSSSAIALSQEVTRSWDNSTDFIRAQPPANSKMPATPLFSTFSPEEAGLIRNKIPKLRSPILGCYDFLTRDGLVLQSISATSISAVNMSE